MKNILIGFLMATCVFLMIGANSYKVAKVGRYQIAPFGMDLVMIDTETAEPHLLLDRELDGLLWVKSAHKDLIVDFKDLKDKRVDDAMQQFEEQMEEIYKKYEKEDKGSY
tara:strand:- start:281 stop:610 length:330 start_codon:yes stop_codon:yes gene_type:complete